MCALNKTFYLKQLIRILVFQPTKQKNWKVYILWGANRYTDVLFNESMDYYTIGTTLCLRSLFYFNLYIL